MYYYFFDRYFGHDRVAWCDLDDLEPGDFFEMVGFGYVFSLGDEISWVEQYTAYRIDTPGEIILLAKGILSSISLQHVHLFTRYWFCGYKKAVSLWIKHPEEYAKRMPRSRKKKSIVTPENERSSEYRDEKIPLQTYLMKSAQSEPTESQKLIVFPDLWTQSQYISADFLKQQGVVLLHAKMTKKQLAEAFWSIKMGKKGCIFATPSQVFHDRYALGEIILIDHHKRYYKQPQDPRYHSVKVCEHLSELYRTHFVTTGFSLK